MSSPKPTSHNVECQGIYTNPKGKGGVKVSCRARDSECGRDKVDTRADGELVRRNLGTITNHLVLTVPDFDQLGFKAWCVTCFVDLT